MNARSSILASWVMCLLVGGAAAYGQSETADVDMEVVKSRLASIQNIRVDYTIDERYSPSRTVQETQSIDLGGGVQVVFDFNPKQYRKSFQFLAGKARYEAELAANLVAGAASHEWKKRIQTHTESRTEVLEQLARDDSYNGNISDPANLPVHSVIDVALGLRGHDENEWLDPETLHELALDSLEGSLLSLEKRDAQIMSRRHVWTFDRDQGFALVRYQVFADDRLYIDVTNSEFETVDNVPLPRLIAWRQHRFDEDGTPIENMAKDVTVERYVLNDPENTADNYLIVFPVGSDVYDARTATPMVIRSGDRTLDDDTLKQVAAQATTAPVSPDADAAADDPRPWPRRWLLIANLVIVAGIVLFVCYRRASSARTD